MNITKRQYKIVCQKTGKENKVNSNLFAHDITKKYYPDILKGEYWNSTTIRFYSQKNGYIFCYFEL